MRERSRAGRVIVWRVDCAAGRSPMRLHLRQERIWRITYCGLYVRVEGDKHEPPAAVRVVDREDRSCTVQQAPHTIGDVCEGCAITVTRELMGKLEVLRGLRKANRVKESK